MESASHKVTNLELPYKLKFHQPYCLSARLQCRAQSSLGNTRHSVAHTLSHTFSPICYFTPIHPGFEQHLHTTGQENMFPTFIELIQESTTAKKTSKGCSIKSIQAFQASSTTGCVTHTFTHPSSLSSKILYALGASESGSTCVIGSVESIFPDCTIGSSVGLDKTNKHPVRENLTLQISFCTYY